MQNRRKSLRLNDFATVAGLFNAGGHPNREVADIAKCSLRTVTNLKKRLAVPTPDGVEYTIPPLRGRGRKKVDDPELEQYRQRLLELIADNPQITKRDMQIELGVSDYMLRKIIKLARISHKRAYKQPRTRNSAEVIQKRRNFAVGILNVPDEQRLYLDETGFNTHTQEEYGWAPMNMTPMIPVNPNRGRNCTLLMAISCFGVEAFRVFPGACNAQILSDFLINDLNPVIEEKSFHLMLDNARFHHSAIVKDSLHSNSKLEFLPPYSPQLNPIEQVFSLVKRNFKRLKVENPSDVSESVIHSVQGIQVRENLLPFYREANKWLGMAFRGEIYPE